MLGRSTHEIGPPLGPIWPNRYGKQGEKQVQRDMVLHEGLPEPNAFNIKTISNRESDFSCVGCASIFGEVPSGYSNYAAGSGANRSY